MAGGHYAWKAIKGRVKLFKEGVDESISRLGNEALRPKKRQRRTKDRVKREE
jgi:hypothetical protein